MNTYTTLFKNKTYLLFKKNKGTNRQNNLLPELRLLRGGLHRLITGSSPATGTEKHLREIKHDLLCNHPFI
jgi:hypothetical protein